MYPHGIVTNLTRQRRLTVVPTRHPLLFELSFIVRPRRELNGSEQSNVRPKVGSSKMALHGAANLVIALQQDFLQKLLVISPNLLVPRLVVLLYLTHFQPVFLKLELVQVLQLHSLGNWGVAVVLVLLLGSRGDLRFFGFDARGHLLKFDVLADQLVGIAHIPRVWR